jgi:membrane-bound metal-dependent hydrolase YbcI (DUF457 family)
MNRNWHLLIGGTAFVCYQVILGSLTGPVQYPWLPGILLVAAGSVLPDVLEPASSRYHRGICHSRGALSLMTILFALSALITVFSPAFPHFVLIYLASCLFLGYVFHLLADSVTPMGLPK